MTPATEITIVTGERYLIDGEIKDIERVIIGAARGSIMELAWLVEAGTGKEIAVNPEHVVMLRAVDLESASVGQRASVSDASSDTSVSDAAVGDASVGSVGEASGSPSPGAPSSS